MARLSCHRFRSNEVPLRLSLIACNLRSRWRLLVLAGKIGNWSLTQPATTAGGDPRQAGRHARCYWLMLAGSHLTFRLFGNMVRRIEALPATAG